MNQSIMINQQSNNANFVSNQSINQNIGGYQFNQKVFVPHINQVKPQVQPQMQQQAQPLLQQQKTYQAYNGQLNQLNQTNLNRNFHSPSKVVYN